MVPMEREREREGKMERTAPWKQPRRRTYKWVDPRVAFKAVQEKKVAEAPEQGEEARSWTLKMQGHQDHTLALGQLQQEGFDSLSHHISCFSHLVLRFIAAWCIGVGLCFLQRNRDYVAAIITCS